MPDDTDDQDIRAVVTLYLDGILWGDADKLRRAFDAKANATGHFGGRLWNDARETFIPDWVAAPPLADGTPYQSVIDMIDRAGDIAVVKVTSRYFDDDYTDYLTLLRDEGAWQITHKAWFAHPVPQLGR